MIIFVSSINNNNLERESHEKTVKTNENIKD